MTKFHTSKFVIKMSKRDNSAMKQYLITLKSKLLLLELPLNTYQITPTNVMDNI